jgi:hypothetical protein
MVLPTHATIRTQQVLSNNITKQNLKRKPVQCFEYYIPTITPSQMSTQQLITQYYLLPTRRGRHFFGTTGIFYDDNY